MVPNSYRKPRGKGAGRHAWRPTPERASSEGMWVFCETHQKRAWTTRDAAKAACRRAKQDGQVGMREYRCEVIRGGWHVGHLPNVIRKGDMVARDFYDRGEDRV